MGYRLLGRLYWFGSMVYRFRIAGLIYKLKRIISAIILMAMVVPLCSCGSILQPTRTGFAEMNSFSDGVYQLNISIDYADDDIVLLYDTVVNASQEKAIWHGEATVYFLQSYFGQDCQSMCDADFGCKEWRGKWVPKEISSPIMLILSWQEQMLRGVGIYDKKRQPISSFHDDLASREEEVFEIALRGCELNWNRLCDVDLDNTFGGNDRLYQINTANVSLLYDANGGKLLAVVLRSSDDSHWLSALITIEPSDESCDVDSDDIELSEGLLNEEWSFIGQVKK